MLRTYVRSDRERHRQDELPGEGDVQRLLQLLHELVVDQPSLFVELQGGVADGDLRLHDASSPSREHLAELGLRPDGAEGPGARADDERRLPAQDGRRNRTRQPVDRVLQLAWDRGVVLRGREQEQVRGGDGVAQFGDLLDARLVVLVEGRQRLEAVPRFELDEGRQKLPRGAEELRVVRVPAQAARDPENLHRRYAPRTKYSSATSLTSFCRAGCPLGSG